MKICLGVCLTLLFSMIYPRHVEAEDQASARINMGFALFRATLSAELHTENRAKKTGHLNIAVITPPTYDPALSALLEKSANQQLSIKSYLVNVHPLNIDAISEAFGSSSFDGIFICYPLPDDQLKKATQLAIENQILLFSPFEKDVERGATAGLFISSRVAPYINTQTAERSNIQFKPYFYKVAKTHAP